METVFTNADFISLDEHNNTYSVMVVKGKNIVYMGYSVPLAYDDTINTVDDNFLSKMKNDAFLINTSRGDLVDNNALKNALLKGEIAGAGLDVFTPEPLEKDNPLLDIKLKDKLILTPHIAGITHLTVERIYKNILENTQNIIHGRELKNKVN